MLPEPFILTNGWRWVTGSDGRSVPEERPRAAAPWTGETEGRGFVAKYSPIYMGATILQCRLFAIALALTIGIVDVRAACTASRINCDSSTSNRLENATCAFSGTGDPYHIYAMDLAAGTVITAYLSSNAFPPFLGIYEGNNSQPSTYDRGNSIAAVRFDVPRTGRYWVLAAADDTSRSGLFTLSVYCDVVCLRPSISGAVPSISVGYGDTATIPLSSDGTPPLRYRWYDMANPSQTLGTSSPPFQTGPLFASLTIGATVTNDCGETSRSAAIVTVAPCTAPTITQQPKDVHVTAGSLVIFTVIGSGPSVTYRWYEGLQGDTSHPIGQANSQQLLIYPVTRSSSYWARLASPCGYVDSNLAKLDVAASRRRSVRK